MVLSVEVAGESSLDEGLVEAAREQLGDAVESVEGGGGAGGGGAAGGLKEVLRLKFDLLSLPIVEDERRTEAVVERIACVARVVVGHRLRYFLSCLATDTAPAGPDRVAAVTIRRRQTFFVKPSISEDNINASAFGSKNNNGNNVAVLFPMWFKEHNDVVIAHSFLQEFVEIRRQASLNTAPIVSYHRQRPLELKDVTHPDAIGANGGYVTFLLNRSHVAGDRLDPAVWALCSFFEYISYHIKCSKASFHASMRKRTTSLMQVLNRAKPAEGAREKKTASGKNFHRTVA